MLGTAPDRMSVTWMPCACFLKAERLDATCWVPVCTDLQSLTSQTASDGLSTQAIFQSTPGRGHSCDTSTRCEPECPGICQRQGLFVAFPRFICGPDGQLLKINTHGFSVYSQHALGRVLFCFVVVLCCVHPNG